MEKIKLIRRSLGCGLKQKKAIDSITHCFHFCYNDSLKCRNFVTSKFRKNLVVYKLANEFLGLKN